MPPHHILVIDDKIPDPRFGAGFPRAYRLLLSLIDLGHKITFYPNIRQTISSLDLELLKRYRIEVITDMDQLPNDIDLIIVSRPHNAHYHMPEAKKRLPHAKVIYDTEALWYRRYDLQLAITGRLPKWAYRYDELGLARQVDLCFVVNDIEKNIQNKFVKEVPSSDIGELIMTKLQNLDEVAYVRFASVYRQFKDINQFMVEIKKLLI